VQEAISCRPAVGVRHIPRPFAARTEEPGWDAGLFASGSTTSVCHAMGTATSVARVEQSAAPFALVARVRRQPAGTAPRSGSAAKFRPASRRPHDPRQARHRARRRGCGVAVCSADESGAYPARRFPRRAERPRVARLAPWGPRWTSNPSGFRGQVALSQLRHEVSVSTPYACGPRLATRFAGPSKRRRLGRRGLGGDGGGDGAGD
jgi:hypothetical protein